MQLTKLHRRIGALEKSCRRPAAALEQIQRRAVERLSDEDLEILIRLEEYGAGAGGLSEREQAAMTSGLAALDEECRAAGFPSWEAVTRR